MTRLPRRARVLAVLRLGATIVGGVATGAGAFTALLAQDWMTVLWAGLAAVWAFVYAAHSCPPPPALPEPEPVERGAQIVLFRGGPEDGGQYALHRESDLLDVDLHISGADYKVTTVEQTAFRADFVQLAHRTDAGDR